MFTHSTDIDFEQSARGALRGSRIPFSSALLWIICAFVGAFIYWANQAELDEVSRGGGKVIPSTAIHVVQNLEGGILSELNISEGDTVAEGDILLRLDDTLFDAQLRENVARRQVLISTATRLTAESGMTEALEFPREVSETRADLVARETALFNTRRDSLNDAISSLEGRLALAREEYDITKGLQRKNVVGRTDVLKLDREIAELEGEIRNQKNQFRTEAMTRLDEINAELERLLESITAVEDRVHRTVLRSPVSGIVNRLHIRTIGSVVGPGEDILEIVPADESLLIEALVLPSDIAFLCPGQKAVVKLTAYDFAIYGGLDGRLEQISADTIREEETGQLFYQIKVRTDETALDHHGEILPIIPGMVAEVDILAGQRTVLQYLLKPFNRARMRALTER